MVRSRFALIRVAARIQPERASVRAFRLIHDQSFACVAHLVFPEKTLSTEVDQPPFRPPLLKKAFPGKRWVLTLTGALSVRAGENALWSRDGSTQLLANGQKQRNSTEGLYVSLAQMLQSKFRGDIRFRGAAYLQAERVAVTRVTSDHLYAVVRDGAEFQTQLTRLNGDLKMFCSCVSEGETRDLACKHLWATILAVDAGQLLMSTPKPGAVPPFAAEPTSTVLLPVGHNFDDDDLPGDVFHPSRERTTTGPITSPTAATAARPTAAAKDWELKLRDLRHAMQGEPTAEAREREVFYEVDLTESRQSGQLVIQTSQRERRNNGQWGKLKPLKLRPGKLEDLDDDDDRRILAYLAGGVPDRSNWSSQVDFVAALFRYRIPYDLALLALPLMCETGRVRFLGESERESKPLRWDEFSPWVLHLSLKPEEENAQWRLAGELRREIGQTMGHAAEFARAEETGESTEAVNDDSDAEQKADDLDAAAESRGVQPVSGLIPSVARETRAATPAPKKRGRKGAKAVAEEPTTKPADLPVAGDAENAEPKSNIPATAPAVRMEKRPLADALLVIPGGLIVTATTIARIEDFGACDWIRMLTTGEQGLCVKFGDEHEFVDQLLDLPTLPELDLPESLRLEEVHAQPKQILRLKSPRLRGWRHEHLQGNVDFDYLGTRVSASSGRWVIVQRDQGRCLVRDRRAEATAWTKLLKCGFRRLHDFQQGRHDVEIPVTELGQAVRNLAAEGWQIQADGKEIRQAGLMQFKVKTGIDWFELSGKVDFNGSHVEFPELLSAIARGDNTIRLDDGSLGIVPEEWLAQFGMLAGLGQTMGDHLRFSTTQVGLVDALLGAQENVEFDEQFLAIRTRLSNFQGIHETTEPVGFHGELRPYQREGVGWLKFLQEFQFGGCLADDMGLGKTVQMLAILQERKLNHPEQLPSLVVVPKSLMFNWVNEIQRFTPDITYLEYIGLERDQQRDNLAKYDVILTTYGTLRRDILLLKEIQFDYAVLDEAQTIKNAASQVAKASRLLKARNRLALSGTPIENHLGDLWSIFEFLNPGMLGRSSVFKSYTADIKDEASRKMLAKGLSPFFLRRTKRAVAADLPEKFEETIYCRMGKRQQALYDELRQYYRESLLGMVRDQGIGKTKMHVLEALLRLRQAACHPALLDRESADEPFAKLDVLIPHLSELIEEGHKSLVFSQFTSMLSIVRRQLDAKGIKYAYLDGQTKRRKQVVEEFQDDPTTHVFLISLKAGGLGLNLTAAEYVFLLDPWWNPAVEAQAIDRAHRVGQTKQVFAYRLICRDTVEEKILELQQKKRDLADAILEADGSVLKDLTTEDLDMLLS